VNKEKTTLTAESEESAPPAKSDIPRGVIAEWTVTILLLLFGTTTLVQAFVIPTGSMAPTLMGRHKEVSCPQCGFVYAVNASRTGSVSPGTILWRTELAHPGGQTDEELARLATVSRTDAERIAVAKIRRHVAVSVISAELETEHGCLLWSFDLRLAGSSGIHEVQIDAGDGRILSVKRETSQQEAVETKGELKPKPDK